MARSGQPALCLRKAGVHSESSTALHFVLLSCNLSHTHVLRTKTGVIFQARQDIPFTRVGCIQ
eukprot:8664661-Alexandrium_andersonii.AAC.1